MYEFTNRRTGEKLRCNFVLATPESKDVLEGLQACVRDEYGDTYPRKDIYDSEVLAEEIRQKRVVALLAVSETGDPVSSLALTPCGGFEDVPEMTMHVVRKPYRDYRIGTVLTKALLELPEVRGFSAITAHSVTFHPMAQHQTISCGFVPTGFLFLIHSNSILRHSFDVKGCIKQSFAVSVYPESKRNAGTLHVTPEHKEFIRAIYARMGIETSFAEGTVGEGETRIHIHQDEIHHTMTAEIFHCGADFDRWVEELLKKAHEPTQTINILIDMNDKAALWGYEQLKKRGFFFFGIHPLCKNGEFLIMHHSLDLTVPFDKLCIDEAYLEVYSYIRNHADKESPMVPQFQS